MKRAGVLRHQERRGIYRKRIEKITLIDLDPDESSGHGCFWNSPVIRAAGGVPSA
jgi:hypothetical protein